MSYLISLPEETIVHILARTPPLGILQCRKVCRFLRELVDSAAELQYLLELYSFGYVPPNNPRLDLSYTEKLSLLREHQRRWKTTMSTQVSTFSLRRVGHSSTYDFYGGIYARGSSFPGTSSSHTRRLDLYQLPSVNKGTEWKQWSHPDLGVDVRDFAMEPDYDLLVLLETNESVPQQGVSQGSPDAIQYFTIHLRSLETGRPHPDAARATIGYHVPSFMNARCSFYFQIVGRYLAVLFLMSEGPGARACRLVVWDWTTGKGVTHLDGSSGGAESFTFLSDRLILIPCPATTTEDAVMRNRGRLDIYTFTEPIGDAPAQPARHIASLYVPAITENLSALSKFSCRCDPAPSPSAHAATRHLGHPRIFHLAPENRVLCLTIEVLTIGGTRGWVQTEGVLYIQFSDLLSAVAHLLDDPISAPVDIAWEDWAKHTSWVNTNRLHTGNECYVYGQRAVSIGIDHTDTDIEDGDEDAARTPSLVVLDFDPIRVRRELCQTESEIEILDPGLNDVLDSPIDEEDMLRDMFLQGAHKADAPFAMRKTLINERLSLNYYVMVDDEHVVIVLQNRFGRESTLLVYSFN